GCALLDCARTLEGTSMRFVHLILLLAATTAAVFAARTAAAEAPHGVWLIDGEAAVEIFDCNGLNCGRILWLQVPRDPAGQLKRDKRNPDPALRQRELCGLTVMRNLRTAGPNQWDNGFLYDPDSGQTYNVKAELS